MRTHEVIHVNCGQMIGWLHDHEMQLKSATFERLDGSHPIAHSKFEEKCPNCGMNIKIPYDAYIKTLNTERPA